jgi:hypothetical protein
MNALEARATDSSAGSCTAAKGPGAPPAYAWLLREKEVLAWLGVSTLINVGDAQRLRLARL